MQNPSPIFEADKTSWYSKKRFVEHGADIEIYRAARVAISTNLEEVKLPKMEKQKEERHRLSAKKKEFYPEYRKARKDMWEVTTAKANIDYLLGLTGLGKNKEQERS